MYGKSCRYDHIKVVNKHPPLPTPLLHTQDKRDTTTSNKVVLRKKSPQKHETEDKKEEEGDVDDQPIIKSEALKFLISFL